jgi:hypothetical protein
MSMTMETSTSPAGDRAVADREMGQHLPPNLLLVGVDLLVGGVDVEADVRIVSLAKRGPGRREHGLGQLEHLDGLVERLVQQAV